MPIYVCMSYILSSLVQFRYLVTDDQVFVKVTYFKKNSVALGFIGISCCFQLILVVLISKCHDFLADNYATLNCYKRIAFEDNYERFLMAIMGYVSIESFLE